MERRRPRLQATMVSLKNASTASEANHERKSKG